MTTLLMHLHHNGIVDKKGENVHVQIVTKTQCRRRENVHEHDVVGGRKAEEQAQRVEGAVSEAVDLESDGDDNSGNDKGIPNTKKQDV